ncbi:hypothetical protein HN858_05440 [Candidatus Falkowbacteria bacterium]|jgi:gamma-glutamyl:cysteine ligase YbdK (ATP-grasp superfamily)|nr:hypothetical protein [Candidatus Falkowbacteria bacterium]MBT7349080.1 hypothetical protein [Candidatus Falkowbacteria bacterium]MBT7500926.1 hypothetical protein [Candidatus Falkowbacteria bacterium]
MKNEARRRTMSSSTDLQEFIGKFAFAPEKGFKIGVERECHLVDQTGIIVPRAPEVLTYLLSRANGHASCYGYELSACQLEERLPGPSNFWEVKKLLLRNAEEIEAAERALGFERVYHGVAPEDMSLEVYPDERYLRITKKMPVEMLRAACRVAGVHILVGMPDAETAMKVYNRTVAFLPELCTLGHTQTGDRLAVYRSVVLKGIYKSERIKLFEDYLTTAPVPPVYKDWQAFYERAVIEGFDEDPRRLWDFIRLSKHGAIEFRMFDTTESIDLIMLWVEYCLDLCQRLAK